MSIIGIRSKLRSPKSDLFLRRTVISNNKTTQKAPIGSIKDNAPLIVPTELPMKKLKRRKSNNNEYLLHGLTDQSSKRSKAVPKLLCRLVDCNFLDIRTSKGKGRTIQEQKVNPYQIETFVLYLESIIMLDKSSYARNAEI